MKFDQNEVNAITPRKNTGRETQYFGAHTSAPQSIRKLFVSLRGHSFSLQTSPEVFSPDEIDQGTRILVENLYLPPVSPTCSILDLGAGYGPISIWLEKEYTLQAQMNNDISLIPQIYASEINERALWLLNRNLVDNSCHAIHVLKGDFLIQVSFLQQQNIQFDAIYCNPPLKIGHAELLPLFQRAMGLLKPHGFLQYVHLKKLGAEGFVQKLITLQPTWSYVITRKKAGYHVFVISPQPIQFPDDIETSTDNSHSGYF